MTILELNNTQAAASNRMVALVCARYGTPDTLKFATLALPKPKPDEIVVRVAASTITSGDRRVRSMDVPKGFRTLGRLALGWHGPRNAVLGATYAGVVTSAGQRAHGFKSGDAVFGISGFRMGAHAEYICVSAKSAVAYKPEHLPFEQAAAIPFGGGTALYFLRRAELRPGETILVNGAAGNVGMATVQLASIMGGTVTGVCSAADVAQVRALGATRVIDYEQQDFTASGRRYDVVFDTACNHPAARCQQMLNPGGRLIRLLTDLPELIRAKLQPKRASRQIIAGTAEERGDHLNYLSDLVGQGLYRPVIARVFPFGQAVEAHRYADSPTQRGSVVIKMDVSAPQAAREPRNAPLASQS